mgnify:CR=1 FL=1
MKIYFNEIIQNAYKLIDNYTEIFPFVNSIKYTGLDAYFITQKYFQHDGNSIILGC